VRPMTELMKAKSRVGVGVPEGVVWNPTFKFHTPRGGQRGKKTSRAGTGGTPKKGSLAALNKRLAMTRAGRLSAAEENAKKMTGKNRL
jgi:hypothetical protein